MPFDGTGFIPPANHGKRPRGGDTLVTILIIAVATLLLLTPISLAALGDIVRALRPD